MDQRTQEVRRLIRQPLRTTLSSRWSAATSGSKELSSHNNSDRNAALDHRRPKVNEWDYQSRDRSHLLMRAGEIAKFELHRLHRLVNAVHQFE